MRLGNLNFFLTFGIFFLHVAGELCNLPNLFFTSPECVASLAVSDINFSLAVMFKTLFS